MGTLVTDQLTKLSLEGGLKALADGFRQVLGSDPPRGCLAVLGAQSVLETGSFQKMHCWNAGNKKADPATWDGLYTQFRCDEIFDVATANRARQLGAGVVSVAPWNGGPRQRVVLAPPHPWSSFAAWPTASEGFADHITLLACNDRYRAAWHQFYIGDPVAAARALHDGGYFTADLDPYARGMSQLAGKLAPICDTVIAGDPLVSDEDRAHVSALVAATMAEARWGSAEQFPLS